MKLVEIFDQRKKVGRPSQETTASEVKKGSIAERLEPLMKKRREEENKRIERQYRKSSKITAALVKISATKVEKVRVILDKGDEKIKAAVLAGEITINKAYNQTLKKPKLWPIRFAKNDIQATLSLNKDLGEVKWIMLGSGDAKPSRLESANLVILHPHS